MPTYSYHCEAGHEFDRYYSLSEYVASPGCACGAPAHRVYKPPVLISARDVSYLSPITGRPITTEAARREDLARSDCVPYDPGIRDDYNRRGKESEVALEAAMDATVEKTIESMPSDQREKLHAELIGGKDAVIERRTPPAKSLKVDIER